MVNSATGFLINTQTPDGGWGYVPDQAASVEATAAVLLALRQEPQAADVHDRGQAWLVSVQHRDGGWGISAGDSQSGWQTAWALLALATSVSNIKSSQRAAQWLLAVKTPEPTEDAMQQLSEVLDIDLTLQGWPWLPGQPTWVEPTALTMLALTQADYWDAPRVTRAVGYLTDRRCRNGGWNVGNPIMFSQPLPPRAHPSAWVLLALNRLAPESIRPEDIEALRTTMAEDGGPSALAWGLLALQSLGQMDPEALRRLTLQQQADGSWNHNPYHTAIAALATAGIAVP